MEGEKLWVGVELRAHASSVFALWGQQSCNQSDSGDDTSTTSNCWYISMTMAVIQEATGYQFSSCTAPPKTAAMYLIEKHPRDRPPSPTTSCRTHRQQCLCPAEPEVAMTPTLKKPQQIHLIIHQTRFADTAVELLSWRNIGMKIKIRMK